MSVYLTDDELVALPANMLTKNDRSRRRRLMRKLKEQKRAQTKARRIARGEEEVRARPNAPMCHGTNKAGEPCGAPRVNGARHCISHLNDAEKAKLGKKTLQEHGAEARRVKNKSGKNAPTLMREVVEVAVEKLISRYFTALGMEFVGLDEEGNPIVIDHGVERGIRIHGESKDGDIEMSHYPDLMAQIQIMEKLMDRTYGKPKQTNVLEGNPNRPIAVRPVRSVERSQKVADLLGRVGAVPGHSVGRSRSQPSEPASSPTGDVSVPTTPPESGATPDNVRPLRPEE